MNQPQQQLDIKGKYYIINLAGGLGARIIQTCFIRSLITKRKQERNDYPILVVDNSLIGEMAAQVLKNQNVISVKVPEVPNSYPHHPGLLTIQNGNKEHPIWVDTWRDSYKQNNNGWLWELLNNNWERAYHIEYGFGLTKTIHKYKKNNSKKSFIGYHYADGMQDLHYDGGVPMLEVSQQEQQVDNFANTQNKPYIVLHLGTDLNPQDYMSSINYRFHKVWSMERWADLVQKLKHKYNFVQVYANEHNPEIPDVVSIKVTSINPVLQLLQHERCRMFMCIDNYLPHLAATIKKPGIVLWGSVSPYVWGWSWQHHKVPHLHLFNDVCDIQPCWRPNMWDTQQSGQQYVCDREYKCMKSIDVAQVVKATETVEKKFVGAKKENEIVL
jgi:ADP-heptose:LPS heptosyltransferase